MYTITDVPELAEWMKSKVAAHPSFRPLSQEELDADVAAGLLITSSEEGQKVERNSGQVNVYHIRILRPAGLVWVQGVLQVAVRTALTDVHGNLTCLPGDLWQDNQA